MLCVSCTTAISFVHPVSPDFVPSHLFSYIIVVDNKMSSSFCQGLQSCLEPCLIESRVLRLKLTSPDSNSSKTSRVSRNGSTHPVSVPPEMVTSQKETVTPSSSAKSDGEVINNDHENVWNNDRGSQKCGWSFLDAISDDAENAAKGKESDEVYVHPTVQRYNSSALTAQSLEMCTEGLGCETGSNASDISDDIALLSLENGTKQSICENKPYLPKKLERRSSFPPPLTSITDIVRVQVRPHREDGRLVLKAVNVSSQHSYFHAERANGRLQLRWMKNFGQDESSDSADEEEEEEEVGENGEMKAEAESEEVGDEGYGSQQEETEEKSWSGKEVEGNMEHAEDEIGVGQFPRRSRCNEDGSGNRVLLNWERFWVAT